MKTFRGALKVLIVLGFLFSPGFAQAQWAKTYGGAGDDSAGSIRQTFDGGYIVAGYTTSFGAGEADFWILKLNSGGSVAWQRTYGGASGDWASSIRQTFDGGYIVAGRTTSFGAGDRDVWVLKLHADGAVAWQKTYGGAGDDYAESIRQTFDGGYIVAGHTTSFGAGSFDFWVLKLDPDGAVAWQRTYGGADRDYAHSIQQTFDGGYIVAGGTESFGAGDMDVWVLKLNPNGKIAWQRTFGGADYDGAHSIQQTFDGGYIVAGKTLSFGAGLDDFWILKLNVDGSLAWQRTYGGEDWEGAWVGGPSVRQTFDGGYIVAGGTESFGAGDMDFWVFKLDGDGMVVWERTYGGADNDWANSIQQTADGGYIVAGGTDSFGAGFTDLWVLKLDADGQIPDCAPIGTSYATVTTTLVTSGSVFVKPVGTTITPADTDVTPADTAVAPGGVCVPLPPLPSCLGIGPYLFGGGIRDALDAPIPGVAVALVGPGGCFDKEITDKRGRYLFPNLAPGTYTVTPWKAGCAFDPPSRTETVRKKSVRADFKGVCPSPQPDQND